MTNTQRAADNLAYAQKAASERRKMSRDYDDRGGFNYGHDAKCQCSNCSKEESETDLLIKKVAHEFAAANAEQQKAISGVGMDNGNQATGKSRDSFTTDDGSTYIRSDTLPTN